MDFNPTSFEIAPALVGWLVVFGSCVLIVCAATLFGMLVSRGVSGPSIWGSELAGTVHDIVAMSPRRVWALTGLTFREAARRKLVYVGLVFLLLFMFAGWFLSGSDLPGEFQVKQYVSVVLTAITWLVPLMVLLLSCWGIPEDIRLRSMHTVVTKPVHRSEIVLGRMLGYGLVGTVVIATVAVVGYFWIGRMLPPSAKAHLTCRRPVFGKLSFLDREGNAVEKGINTGDVWEFRSYIEGATKARALWTFDGVNESMLDSDGNLILESRFLAFRSYKGDMQRSLYFQFALVNPETGLRYADPKFKTVNEFRSRTDTYPRQLKDGEETRDLLKDLVTSKGQLTVEVACIDPNQYIGMARPDLFIRTPDAPFRLGYFKAILCSEMVMLLVVFLGVATSTFAKGPVSTWLTSVTIVVGLTARDFMGGLVRDPEVMKKLALYAGQQEAAQQGGGVFESIYRILTHMNPVTPLPEGPGYAAMQAVDNAILGFLWLVYQIIPNFDSLHHAITFLAEGFDVPWDSAVLPSIALTAGFFLPCLLLGHFALRVRELESK